MKYSWRMPMHANPNSPCGEDQRQIHPQKCDGRPSRGRQAKNLNPFAIPSKVVAPFLDSRIKQRGRFTGFRISPVGAIRFEAVASGTGQAQIFRGCFTAAGAGEDVVDFVTLPAEPL